MSRIFDALKKAGGELGDISLPLVVEDQLPITPFEPPHSDRAPTPNHVPTRDHTPPTLQVRTLPLRVPADVPVLPFDGAHSRAAEQYRIIRTKIVQHPAQPRLLLISSPGPGDGKTISAVNIAGALALRNEANVLLVDADFRRSNAAGLLGLPAEHGLGDVLAGVRTLEDVIIRTEQFPNLYVLPGSKLGPHGARWNPTELLDSPAWKTLCASLRERFRFVVVDAPPIGAVADYDLIQAACDGIIIVLRPDHTSRARCLQALETLPKDKLVGVVMNCAEEWFLGKTHDYYYYSSSEAKI